MPNRVIAPSHLTRVLILGGTSEATALAQALAERQDLTATISFAGRTIAPIVQPIPVRIGGFGGVDGLAAYLQAEQIDILVDATHPFAQDISRNATQAAERTGTRLIRISRPAWQPEPGDLWQEAADMAVAAAMLGVAARRVFLTIGSLQLAAFAAARQHAYLVRTIDPVTPEKRWPGATFITGRGPFTLEDEERLMRDHRIDVLVTKNSGGSAAQAKLAAARQLGIRVVLIRRPAEDSDGTDWRDAFAAICAHRPPARRGV